MLSKGGYRVTRDDLKQIYHITREIKKREAQLSELRELTGAKAQRLTGMPRGGNISDETGNAATRLLDLEMILLGEKKKLEMAKAEVILFISQIEDSYIRRIVEYRHYDLLPWKDIADLMGGRATTVSIRKTYSRWIREALPDEHRTNE